tara:strand:+ start:273 stop:473 length:201 start_codon:yes stop_codon:yes gene_type:complete
MKNKKASFLFSQSDIETLQRLLFKELDSRAKNGEERTGSECALIELNISNRLDGNIQVHIPYKWSH